MSKPSILLAPHSFGLPEFYDPIFDAVRARGYDIRGLHLPSSGLRALEGRPGEPATMYDDAVYIAREVEKLADAGKDVVVIGHSYGGVPVTQSCEGLSKEERQRQGKAGGLVHLAFMSSPVAPIGENADSFRKDVQEDHVIELNVDEHGWLMLIPPEATAKICFSTLPLEEGTAEALKFPRQSAVSFTNLVTYARYKDVPCSYLFSEQDLCVPPHVQQNVIDMIEKASGIKVDVTRIQADHCPNITAKQEVIDWIVGLGEKCTL